MSSSDAKANNELFASIDQEYKLKYDAYVNKSIVDNKNEQIQLYIKSLSFWMIEKQYTIINKDNVILASKEQLAKHFHVNFTYNEVLKKIELLDKSTQEVIITTAMQLANNAKSTVITPKQKKKQKYREKRKQKIEII